MATPNASAVRPYFFDTMCLSHFARADRLDVLRELLLERDCWTTSVVQAELRRGAEFYPSLAGAVDLEWLRVAPLDTLEQLSSFVKWANRLGSQERDLGEASVFAAAELLGGIAITDDRDATKVARRHRAEVHGTVWLLAQACRSDKLTRIGAGSIVDALRETGARLPCTGTEFPSFAVEHGLLDLADSRSQ